MAKTYNKPITLDTDWGGDASTGNVRVAGKRVQELIKKTFATKGGYFQVKDKKFLQVFADEESAKLYNSDNDKYSDFLLSNVQLPNTGVAQATMKVSVLAFPSEYTTSGRKEVFQFHYNSYYEDEGDISQVAGSCVVYVNNTQKERISLRAGNTYEIDVTKYLVSGINDVRFVIDNAEQSKRTYAYEVQMLTLEIKSDFDSVTAYTGTIPFTYTPIGDGTKTVHILVDDSEIYAEETDVTNRQQTLDLPAQEHGAHKLVAYLTASVQGIELESERLSFSVICIEDGNENPIISSKIDSINTTQYESVSIPFVVYDPLNNPTDIELLIDNEKTSTRQVDRTQQSWIYKAMSKGDFTLGINCRGIMKSISMTVGESIITSEAETQNLELFLTSQGRSNQDTNRGTWEYNGITAKFTGLNYTTNGWCVDSDGNTAMRLSGGATMNIPLNLFATDLRQTGKTIEIEFAVRQITDYNSLILSCLQGGVGLELTPNTIKLTSEQSSMETKYKEDERVRVSFVIEKRANNRLMQIYINGIKSQSVQYPDNDGFTQPSPVGITVNSENAVIDIYNIRSYSNNLNDRQLLDNYIADMDDTDKKMTIFKRNQVYDTYGNLSYNKLAEQIPILTITGTLPRYKGDKQTVKLEYVDRQHPEKSFTAADVELNVQGTSSQYDPTKNYKGKAKKGFTMSESGNHEDNFTLNEDAVLPANVFCWKADFADSSGAHNTGLANYISWMLQQAKIQTEPQKENPIIRTTVYGEPCLIFHREKEGDTPRFIGKYNFNTDKSAVNTFGFSDGDESWEFSNNTSDRSNFRSDDFDGDGWKNDFEARYPDGSEDISHMREVFAWVVSCKEDLQKFKDEFDEHFDKKSLIFYYLITLVFGMVDQRAKNQFLTYYQGGKWLFIFYDNDTVFGINNEGAIKFSYNIEIHDVIGNLNVWNGANSLLWELIEQAFADDIKTMYQDLRQKGILSYDHVIEFCNTRESDKWCEAVYNEDGYCKYESPLIDGYTDYSSGSAQTVKTGAYLFCLQGSRDAHRRWWLFNRFKYMDSKFQAGSSLSDYIVFRTYTPSEWAGVEPNADITISSFLAMYGTIRWGSVVKSERMGEGETRTIKAPAGTKFNDTETIIYNASMIGSIGDLSALYVGSVDVSKATNITELIIGSSVSGYKNQNFDVLSLGTNAKLRKLDISNCPNYTSSIDVSGCENIEEIYARGTGATSVNLAEGGSLRVLQLPGTITNLTIKNQSVLSTGLTLESWANLVALVIDNCPKINAFAIVKSILSGENALQRVRLTDIIAIEDDFSILSKLSNLRGIGDNGEYTNIAYLKGTFTVKRAIDYDLQRYRKIFPYLTINANVIVDSRAIDFVIKSDVGYFNNAQVTIGTETKKVENGNVHFQLEDEKTYDYTISYGVGCIDSGSIELNKANIQIKRTYKLTESFKNMKPNHDGNIQFTVYDEIAIIEPSYDYRNLKVDWGDGIVDDNTSHIYTDGNQFHNVSVSVTATSFNISSNVVAYAFWSWGDFTYLRPNKCINGNIYYVGGDYFADGDEITSLNSYFYAKSIRNVDKELFYNLPNLTSLEDIFDRCGSLDKIPAGLLDKCTNVTNFFKTFFLSGITEIPAGLFDKCTNATNFGFCFAQSANITEIPAGLFDKCTNATNFEGTFSLMRNVYFGFLPLNANINANYNNTYGASTKLRKMIVNSTTPVVITDSTFDKMTEFTIYVPDAAIETYKSAEIWSGYADKIVGFSELTDEEKHKYGIA